MGNVNRIAVRTDIVIIGGGSAGCLAAIRAKELNPRLEVVILEKGEIRRSGALAMGMDALNIVAVPGVDTPETYVEAAGIAAGGIMDQTPSYVMAKRSYALMQKLEKWNVRFIKDEDGNYTMLKIHPKGKFCAAMDEPDLKVVLARKVREAGAKVLNRIMATSLLTHSGQAVGVFGFNVRTGESVVVQAKAIILSNGGCSRFTVPNSGYLNGTFDYPGNSGEGYAMAYRAGATLTGMEYTHQTTLIKDISCPLLYITTTRGAKVVNALGQLLGNGQIPGSKMAEEYREGRGPVFIDMRGLPEKNIKEIEQILFNTERPLQKRFFAQRGIDFRTSPIELYPTEFQLCGGHGLSGLVVNERAETTLPGLYACGDVASVPRQHLTGAFVFGEVAAEEAVKRADLPWTNIDENKIRQEEERLFKPFSGVVPSPISLHDLEYKARRIIGDYAAPPKNEYKLDQCLRWVERLRNELAAARARDYHELGKIWEIDAILECAALSATASKVRKESRWGVAHVRADYPGRNDDEWLKHVDLRRASDESINVSFRPIERSVL